MPRLGWRTVALLVSLVVGAAFFAPSALAQEANETAEGGAGTGEGNATADAGTRKFVVKAQESGCPEGRDPCWDMPVFGVLPGDKVEVTVVLEGSAQPHDFSVELSTGTLKVPNPSKIGGVHTLTVDVPSDLASDGRIEFFCSVHQTTMVGFFGTPAALTAGAAHEEEVPHMGVHFLAYWVGIIAFAILFFVYGVTFFLFKYNETSATTDHWDRTGSGAEPRRGGRFALNALVLAIAIAVLVGAAMLYLIQRGAITDLNHEISGLQATIAAQAEQLKTAQGG